MKNKHDFVSKLIVLSVVVTGLVIGFFAIAESVFAATPEGYLDAADCESVRGWAWDADTPNVAIPIAIYIDGQTGQISETARIPASLYRSDLGKYGNSYHAFNWTIPTQFRDGKSHKVYAYAIDTSGNGPNPLISGSPKTFSGCSGQGQTTTPTYPLGSAQLNQNAPFINSFSPSTGQQGNSIYLYGDFFQNGSRVTFGGVNAATSWISNRELVATVPSGSGSVQVRVVNPNNTYATFERYNFTYTGTTVTTTSYTQNPSVPSLRSPSSGSTVSSHTPLLEWYTSNNTSWYRIEVDNNSDFRSLEYANQPIYASVQNTPYLNDGTYYWRVRAYGTNNNWSDWSSTWWFRIETSTPPPQSQSASLNSLTASAYSINSGNSVTITGSGSYIDHYTVYVNCPSGVSMSASYSGNCNETKTVYSNSVNFWLTLTNSASSPQSVAITVRVFNSNNQEGNSQNVSVTVNPSQVTPPPPSSQPAQLNSLNASTYTINSGNSVTVTGSGSNIDHYTVYVNCPSGVSMNASYGGNCNEIKTVYSSSINFWLTLTNSTSNTQTVIITVKVFNSSNQEGGSQNITVLVNASQVTPPPSTSSAWIGSVSASSYAVASGSYVTFQAPTSNVSYYTVYASCPSNVYTESSDIQCNATRTIYNSSINTSARFTNSSGNTQSVTITFKVFNSNNIEGGSASVSISVYPQTSYVPVTTYPNVTLRVNGFDFYANVVRNAIVTVTWDASSASYCQPYSDYPIPKVDGGVWADGTLGASGTRQLYARHRDVESIRNLKVGIRCYSYNNQSMTDEATINITSDVVVTNNQSIIDQINLAQLKILALQADIQKKLMSEKEETKKESGGGLLSFLLAGLEGIAGDSTLGTIIFILGLLFIIALFYILWLVIRPYIEKKE